MCSKLESAIRGQTVIVTWKEIGMNYDDMTGFTSLADLSNWCVTFGLQCTTLNNPDGSTSYQISKLN